jgi:hypothetical protein
VLWRDMGNFWGGNWPESDLEGEVFESMGYTGLLLVSRASFCEKSDCDSGLVGVDGGDLDTSSVDDGGEGATGEAQRRASRRGGKHQTWFGVFRQVALFGIGHWQVTMDPLQTLQAALTVQANSKEQADILASLREALELQPAPISVLVAALVGFVVNAGDSLLKTWVIDLLHFAICRAPLSLEQRTQRSS